MDYDSELFGAPSASMQGVDVEEETLPQEVESLWPETLVQERKTKSKSLVPCNAPGGMFDFAKYVQDGGYVPEAVRNAQVIITIVNISITIVITIIIVRNAQVIISISINIVILRNTQVGLELEVFASNPGDDIKERMANFTEMNFYDGTLNLNISLQQAHTNMSAMLSEVSGKHICPKFKMFKNLSSSSRKKRTRPEVCVTRTLCPGHFPTSSTASVIPDKIMIRILSAFVFDSSSIDI